MIAQAFVAFFENDANKEMIDDLLTVVTLEKEEQTNQVMDMEGLQFVITGSVNHFANRKEVKELIEQHGGKVTGSVTGKTSYLINNDNLSRSSKNKKAKESFLFTLLVLKIYCTPFYHEYEVFLIKRMFCMVFFLYKMDFH